MFQLITKWGKMSVCVVDSALQNGFYKAYWESALEKLSESLSRKERKAKGVIGEDYVKVSA